MEEFIAQNQWIILIAALWTLPWKAIALWKSARREEKGWFIVLLLMNTLAILEIIYIFVICKDEEGVEDEGEEK